MAVPTIDTTQSVLGYLQYETFQFQPLAFDGGKTITAWAAVGLPSGLAINSSTGLISGAVPVPGVYVIGVKATNADGDSQVAKFTIGIEDSSGVSLDASIDIGIDVASGLMRGPGDPDEYVFHAKSGDTKMLHIRFYKGDIRIKPELKSLKFTCKEFEPERKLVESTIFENVNTGEYYKLPVTFESPALRAALANYEGDKKTGFRPGIEIEWQIEETVGEETVVQVGSTQSAVMLLERDFIETEIEA